MRSGHAAGVWWLAALGAACAVRPPAHLPDAPLVDHVEVEGAKALKPREVKQRIVTTESSWLPVWLPFLGDPQWFDPNAWQADLRRVERLYQSRGYYGARVVEDEVRETRPGHVTARLKVEEGAPAKLVALEVQGLEGLEEAQRAQVLQGLPLHLGDVFQEEAWEAAKDQLASRLRQLGYAEAAVKGEVIVDLGPPSADALLETSPGARYRFGRVFVAADPGAKVPPKKIIAQVESVLKPGDWYSDAALNEAQARVFSLGVFAAVKVNRGAADRAEGSVPVVVDVREAPFQTLRFGGGFGLDQLRNEVRLTGEWTNRNFFGGLRRFSVRGKFGWAFLPNVVEVALATATSRHGPVGRVLFEFEQPQFLTRTLTLQSTLDLNTGVEPAYSYYGFSYRLGVAWRPLRWLSVVPAYNLDLYGLTSDVPLGGAAPEVLYGCPQLCIVSSVDVAVEVDLRDDRLEPKNGFYGAFNIQGGGGPLGGAFTFLRILPELRGYVSFAPQDQVTVAAKVKLGTLLSADDRSPIISRFFSGGGNSMRAFGARRLSPQLLVPAGPEPAPGEPAPSEARPIGGRGLFEASLEVRWNVWGDLVLAAFGDTGFVTSGPFDFTTPAYFGGNLFWGVGGGLRYRTPIGPVRLDFAYRLPVGPPLELVIPGTQALAAPPTGGCFGIGAGGPYGAGSPEGVCSLHISVGEAF